MPSRRHFILGAGFSVLPSASATAAAGAQQAQNIGNAPVYPRTAREAAAAVLPANPAFPEFDIRRYGADMTGVNASDTAFANWLRVHYTTANRTNPAGMPSGRGLGVAYLPKGRIRLTTGYVAPASAIGLIIRGEGQDATAIEYHSDSGAMFTQAIYENLLFEDLTLSHVPQNADPTSWACTAISLTGNGGGRKFGLNRVRMRNFHRNIEIGGTVNGDTTHFEHCEFIGFSGASIYSRNSQAVINTFVNCTWIGGGEAVFDYAGLGQTSVINGNIIIDGAWLKPFGEAGRWGPAANMVLINCKGEGSNRAGRAAGSRSAILMPHGDWSQIRHQIQMIGCGFSGGTSLDAASFQIALNSGIDLSWDGGHLVSSARIITHSAAIPGRHRGVKFANLRECPLPSNLSRDSSAVGSHPSVTFFQCANTEATGRIPNITIGHREGSRAPVTLNEPEQLNQLAQQATVAQPVVAQPGTSELSLPFYGAAQQIEEVSVELIDKPSGSGELTFDIYLDAARVRPIETIRFTSADDGPYPPARKASAALGRVTTEGVFITARSTNILHGYVHVRHRAR